ncbi:hypothetical protein AAFF_G00067050 [Aldrovandia affinis]|uniref:Uncharacterized protein n=1 Tax=Aldrovandia affinis TaxID=143900 RepID=A0AAD7T476_9TELE|nr:hypothetical protein AAFF_G00067050 [Aldrovandia affinis]
MPQRPHVGAGTVSMKDPPPFPPVRIRDTGTLRSEIRLSPASRTCPHLSVCSLSRHKAHHRLTDELAAALCVVVTAAERHDRGAQISRSDVSG